MHRFLAPLTVILSLLLVIIIFSAAYIVDETNQAVITQFGEPVGDPIVEPGLHFKVPVIQKVDYFDKRLLEWDGDPNRIPTKDKKYIWIDTTARWKIIDPLKFLQTVHDEYGAQTRLDDILDGATRNVIAKHNLIEIVRNSNRITKLEDSKENKIMGQKFERIPENSGRDVIRSEMFNRAKSIVSEYGIELVDLRIKRINYDAPVRNKVFERMISERKRAAELLRAEGLGEKAEIEGKKEKELQRIKSEAYEKAQKIRGEADAKAIKIYADAYSNDPEYYAFLNTLESYYQTLDDKSMLILSSDTEYFKYLNESN